MLIEIHMIQNHSPANHNRDGLGAPRTSMFGGVTRTRILSRAGRPGQALGRRLREGWRQVRVGIYGKREQLSWLERKAGDGGLRVTDQQGLSEGKVCSGKPADKDPRDEVKDCDGSETPPEGGGRKPDWGRMPMLSVRLDGVLRVTDPDLFLKTLQSAIGSGKAFGFGLLSMARA